MAPIFEKSSIIDVWHGPNPVPATLNKRLPFEYSALSFNDTAIFTVLFDISLLYIMCPFVKIRFCWSNARFLSNAFFQLSVSVA